jgi:hypothetical protein
VFEDVLQVFVSTEYDIPEIPTGTKRTILNPRPESLEGTYEYNSGKELAVNVNRSHKYIGTIPSTGR